jgi:hypothetical protein
VATFASFDNNLSSKIKEINAYFRTAMATRCKARQDRWLRNITFGTPVSLTIREADVPDMETKTKREGSIFSVRGGR